MFLPVVTRELRLHARRKSTPYIRAAAALGLIVIATPTATFVLRTGASTGAGQILLQTLSWVLMLFALFEGIRTSAGLISDERRDGTLGLLFLTDLSAVDILLGKLAGAGLTAFYGLVATVPVLFVAVLAGGVTGGELVRGASALLNALLLALAAGLWASARAREGWMAMLTALGLILGLVCLPLFVEAAFQGLSGRGFDYPALSAGLLSPALSLGLASDAIYVIAPIQFWASQLVQPAVAAGLVVLAGSHLRRHWRESPASHPAPTPTTPTLPGAAAAPTQSLPTRSFASPEVSVAAGLTRRFNLRRWGPIVLALGAASLATQWVFFLQIRGLGTGISWVAAFSFLLQLPAVLAALALALLLAHLAARTFGDARHSGELELLLTTPLAEAEMVRTLWYHLRKLVAALTALAVVNALALQVACRLFPAGGGTIDSLAGMLAAQNITALLHAWFGNAALIWVGFWFGLTQRRPLAAAGWTFGLVGILTPIAVQLTSIPFFLAFNGISLAAMWVFPFFQAVLSTTIWILWIRWARQRLARSFRTVAAGGA